MVIRSYSRTPSRRAEHLAESPRAGDCALVSRIRVFASCVVAVTTDRRSHGQRNPYEAR